MHRNYAVIESFIIAPLIENCPMDVKFGVKTASIIDLIDSVPSFYSSREAGKGDAPSPCTLSRLDESKLGGGAAGGELCLGLNSDNHSR